MDLSLKVNVMVGECPEMIWIISRIFWTIFSATNSFYFLLKIREIVEEF